MALNYHSDVYSTEIDRSQAAPLIANTYAILFGAATKGPVEPQFITSMEQMVAVYGKPSAAVSMMHYTAMSFFGLGGGGCWVRRVVDEMTARYGGALVVNPNYPYVGSVPGLSADGGILSFAARKPEEIDLTEFQSPSNELGNLFSVYALGPGSYSGQLAIEIVSQNLKVPVVTATSDPSPTGASSTLVPGTYSYVVTAFNSKGETTGSNEAQIAVEAGEVVTIPLTPQPGALGFRIYRKATTGQLGLIGTASPRATQFVDNGLVADTQIQPPTASVEDKPFFTLNVYDFGISMVNPVESFEVSLMERINLSGEQTEIEQRVNSFSEYIRVAKNPLLSQYPTIYSVAKHPLGEGSSGNVITDGHIMLALDEFKDKESYPAAVICNCGYPMVSVQRKMNEVAEYRRDILFFVDTPADKQKSMDAVSYRSVELGINSDRGAIFNNDNLIRDPYNNVDVYVPGSGIAAGMLALTDRVTNPSYSPAGYQRGVAISTIKTRHKFTGADMDLMAQAGVNYFATERGYGTVLREAYTLQSEFSSLSFIPVRRVLDISEQATEKALKIYLHEPNDEITEMRIVSMLDDFYRLMVEQRMIKRAQVIAKTSDADIQLGNRRVYSIITPMLPVIRIHHTTIITRQGEVSFETVNEALGG